MEVRRTNGSRRNEAAEARKADESGRVTKVDEYKLLIFAGCC